MIRFEHVSKTFQTKNGPFDALTDVSFEIEKGYIYGVIGYSRAGKSSLIRMVNALETPTSGNVWVEGKDIGTLNQKELRNLRKGIGMIFQQFNLLESKTIYDNVAIALKLNGISKKDIEKRVTELLDFVDRDCVGLVLFHVHAVTRESFYLRAVHQLHTRLLHIVDEAFTFAQFISFTPAFSI